MKLTKTLFVLLALLMGTANAYGQYAYDFYSNNYGSQSSYHYIMNLTGGNTVHVIAVMPNPNTKTSDAMIFTTFWAMATNIGMREFCIPIYQPDRQKSPSTAGAPHIHILK